MLVVDRDGNQKDTSSPANKGMRVSEAQANYILLEQAPKSERNVCGHQMKANHAIRLGHRSLKHWPSSRSGKRTRERMSPLADRYQFLQLRTKAE